MKIVIPVDGKDIEANVCESFGRTPYYLVYDTETEESEFIDNSAATSAGGAGIRAAQAVVDTKANVLLTPRCGENAAEVLEAAGIEIYKTEGTSIKENIDAFVEGKLSLLDEIHAGFHGHGRGKRGK
ncbi:MAG: NifB/NifX family molybdenum-iron cluster-binding protein [Natronincolaceae bacterium]|nr:NifB/NifX family molybdenum-iron cluster-binding protein [Bacillota bacterium]NLK89964.1 dinitrogenase iron-molybdenum cofactor biosynthesis protein [Clostridiales bacterium]